MVSYRKMDKMYSAKPYLLMDTKRRLMEFEPKTLTNGERKLEGRADADHFFEGTSCS